MIIVKLVLETAHVFSGAMSKTVRYEDLSCYLDDVKLFAVEFSLDLKIIKHKRLI